MSINNKLSTLYTEKTNILEDSQLDYDIDLIFQQLVTPLEIFHPKKKLESVCFYTYHALIYFPKAIPEFCRGIYIFVVSYKELFHIGIIQ